MELICGEVKTVISLELISTGKGMGNGTSGVGECDVSRSGSWLHRCVHSEISPRYMLMLCMYVCINVMPQ